MDRFKKPKDQSQFSKAMEEALIRHKLKQDDEMREKERMFEDFKNDLEFSIKVESEEAAKKR